MVSSLARLGAVVAVVEEDDDIALFDGAVDVSVVDGLHELVGDAVGIGEFHGLHHILGLEALAADEQVVGYLHALPALVAVHGVEAADDAGDVCAGLIAFLLQLADEAHAGVRVGVAAVHEAVHVGLANLILFGNLAEFVEVVEAGVHAAVAGEAHEVHSLALAHGILEGALHLLVLHDAAVLAGAVDFHEVLIDDASGTDIQVAHLRVTHLSVGQTHVLAAGLQLAVGIGSIEIVHVGCRRLIDDVAFLFVADAPSVEDHQQSFLCHIL